MTHLGELEDALGVGVLVGSPDFSHHQICHVLQDGPVHEVQRVRLAVAQHSARHIPNHQSTLQELYYGVQCVYLSTLPDTPQSISHSCLCKGGEYHFDCLAKLNAMQCLKTTRPNLHGGRCFRH